MVVHLLVGIFVAWLVFKSSQWLIITLFGAYSLRIWIPIFNCLFHSYTFIICDVNESSSFIIWTYIGNHEEGEGIMPRSRLWIWSLEMLSIQMDIEKEIGVLLNSFWINEEYKLFFAVHSHYISLQSEWRQKNID